MSTYRDAFCILQVADVDRSVAFYHDHFGHVLEYAFPDDLGTAFASVMLGTDKLGFGRADGDIDTSAASLWLYVDDVDAAIAELRAAGVHVVAEPADQPWGERVADVRDPDGYTVHLGAPIDGAPQAPSE